MREMNNNFWSKKIKRFLTKQSNHPHLSYSAFANQDYKETLNQALRDVKTVNAKQGFRDIKRMTKYENNSKILDISRGPILGKFCADLKGKILDNDDTIGQEIQEFLRHHYRPHSIPPSPPRKGINITFDEILPIIQSLKGGKALSTDCIPDFSFSKKFLRSQLKYNPALKERIVFFPSNSSTRNLIDLLEFNISRNLASLFNLWLSDGHLPAIHATAKNFFIFKNQVDGQLNTIDELRPISATSIFFKLMEIIIKKRLDNLEA